jgi:heme oxygenase
LERTDPVLIYYFCSAAKAAFEKQVELEKLANQHKSQTDRMTEIEQDLQTKTKEIEDMKEIVS